MTAKQEREANTFARKLLLPESMVKRWWKKHPTALISTFASTFGVNENLATARLLELGFDIGDGTNAAMLGDVNK